MTERSRAHLAAAGLLLAVVATVLSLVSSAANAAPNGKKVRATPTPSASTSAPRPAPTASSTPAPSSAPSASATPAPTTTPRTMWSPAPRTPWQIQFAGALNLSVDVPVYDLDGFDTSAQTVTRLRTAGRHAICYISAGSWEDWRPDAASFPASVLGRTNGWPGERWLDIRQLDVLGPILSRRMQMCQDKGFEAVDPDNVDGYVNETGFALTAEDQLTFNRWLAAEAHRHGLSIGLKNDLDQVHELVDVYDFAVNEQCVEYDECEALLPFVDSGKAVLHVEYSSDPALYCPVTAPMGLSSLAKELELTAWRRSC